MNSPQGLKRHSPNGQSDAKASFGVKSSTNGKGQRRMVDRKGSAQEEVWAKLVGRANEERIFINRHPVTVLLDTWGQVTHVSHDFCLPKTIKIHPITQLVNMEGTGDNMEYVGYIEAKLFIPMGSQIFDIEVLLLVCPPLSVRKGCLWQ